MSMRGESTYPITGPRECLERSVPLTSYLAWSLPMFIHAFWLLWPYLGAIYCWVGSQMIISFQEQTYLTDCLLSTPMALKPFSLRTAEHLQTIHHRFCGLQTVLWQVSVRKLDLSHLCFSLNFLFSYVFRNFLPCFPCWFILNHTSPYLLITRDTQDEGEARFRFYWYRKQSKSNFMT